MKSRFEVRRNSIRKSGIRLSFNTSDAAKVDAMHEPCAKNLPSGDTQHPCTNDDGDKDLNQKEDTLKENVVKFSLFSCLEFWQIYSGFCIKLSSGII